MGQVDEPVTGLERALLAVERAVVRGHAGVDAVAGDGAGQGEQRAGHGVVTPSDAGAEDGQVADVDGEAVVGGQAVDERVQHIRVNRD